MEDVRWPAEQLEEHHLEISNRIRNLFWTVSGDYDTEFEPDTEKYVYSKQTVLYEAVKQGAFARYFDQKKLGMYLMKKLHFSAGEDMLLPLQRFRNYEEPRETNERIFQFRAYANNRDGLALKTVCSSLMERPEKNKILIVLSDGKPCDMSIQRPGTRQPRIYDGEGAVKDTAYEVRRARNQGIWNENGGITMGKIEFANCQDVRNQKKIQELDCPHCHEPGGIEAFVKDGILAEDGVCDNCGYILPEGTELEEVE